MIQPQSDAGKRLECTPKRPLILEAALNRGDRPQPTDSVEKLENFAGSNSC